MVKFKPPGYLNGAPNYVVNKPKFTCPLSSGIAWHWGLTYLSCPVNSDQRDMMACKTCPLKSDNKEPKDEYKVVPKKRKNKEVEVIPVIKRTYHSHKEKGNE